MATIGALQALVTKTTTFDGAHFDATVLTKNFYIEVRVRKLTADAGQTPKVRFELQGSAIGDFTDKQVRWTKEVTGRISDPDQKAQEVKFTIPYYDLSMLTTGAGDEIRLSLAEATGTGVSCTYEAWVFYD